MVLLMNLSDFPESTVVNGLTITRRDIDALSGGRAALEVLAAHSSPGGAIGMRADSAALHELTLRLIRIVAEATVAQVLTPSSGVPS
jgi:hypothetical protein